MTGRVIIVTGATSGIGYETAKYLAEGGNDVVLACSNEARGAGAVNCIREKLPNALVSHMQLDLASETSVRDFVKTFTRRKRRLSVLVHCAGVKLTSRERHLTADCAELTMATNYLGPFLLTHLLLDYLVQTANILGEGRVVMVTCSQHDPAASASCTHREVRALDPTDLSLSAEGAYSPALAYHHSKLCGALFTYRLARQLKGTRVTANLIDPGYVPTTQLSRHASRLAQLGSGLCVGRLLACTSLAKSPQRAGREIAELATSDNYEMKSSKFYRDGVEDRSAIETYDDELQDLLWRETCRLLRLSTSMAEDDDLDRISLGENRESRRPLLQHKKQPV